MLTFDIRTNARDVMLQMQQLQKKHLPRATLDAVNTTGRYMYGALRAEMNEVFDRPTRWALTAVQINQARLERPVLYIWINEDPNKGTPGSKFLKAQLEGGERRHKRFERALIMRGLMPASMFAVPTKVAPVDAHGNVPASFVVRILSDLQAFGEQGYRANRRGTRRGARRSNYFFVPYRNDKAKKPGIWWHMPNGMLMPVFIFTRSPRYARRYDFYGVARRAYDRVALRFMTEALAKRIRSDNR